MGSTTAEPLAGTERHPHARAVLGGALPPAGSPSHAYLLHGPSGAGKRTAARAFAEELLADGAADQASARARVRSGAHPDLTWVTPSGAHELIVEDIEEPVVAAVARTPFEARRRVFVIEAADTMNDTVANRMLKTLEEPPAYAHLLLLTDRPGEVLPTIASRCQAVRFDALAPGELAARLRARGVAAPTAEACARLAMGDAGRAVELAQGDGAGLRDVGQAFATAALEQEMDSTPWRALLEAGRVRGDAVQAALDAKLAQELESVARSDRRRRETAHRDRARRARRRAETAALDLGLGLTGLWLRDLACLAWGAPDQVGNVDRIEALRSAPERPAGSLRAAVDAVEETRRRLRLNVTAELALEALGYRLEALLAG